MTNLVLNYVDVTRRAKLCLGVLFALVLCFSWSGVSEARLRGDLSLVYRDYESKQDGGQDVNISQFSQRYSVFWDKKGLIKGGRAGRYDLGLGYEWLSTATEFNGDDDDVSDGKLLYKGDITVAPGGLPFRLHAYSYDTASASQGNFELSGGILDPKFDGLVGAGESRKTGLTLLLGIRNGNDLGRFREVLSKYPRLISEYKENF